MINWSDLSPKELASAMRALKQKILYAWSQNENGSWCRRSAWEYDTDRYPILTVNDAGLFRGKTAKGVDEPYPTLEEAKASWDKYYLAAGWLLLAADDGSGTPLPPPHTDWPSLTGSEFAGAIRTIPKLIAYAWTIEYYPYSDSPETPSWVRHDCEEYGYAQAAHINLNEDGLYRGPSYDPATGSAHPNFADLDDCKAAHDRYLIQNGWILNDAEVRPALARLIEGIGI